MNSSNMYFSIFAPVLLDSRETVDHCGSLMELVCLGNTVVLYWVQRVKIGMTSSFMLLSQLLIMKRTLIGLGFSQSSGMHSTGMTTMIKLLHLFQIGLRAL